MEDEAHLLQRASQCRRLARDITNPNDPAVARLIEMAEELEAQAAALKTRRDTQSG
jgi:hypothetical protein